MRPLVLCPVSQRIPAHKAHDKLVARTALALAHAGARVQLYAPAPVPDAQALAEHYAAPPTSDLLARGVPPAPRFLYRWRLRRRLAREPALAIYTSELKVAHSLLGQQSAPLYYEAHTLEAEVARARGGRFHDRREAEVLAGADGVLCTTQALAERLRETYGAPRRMRVVPLASGWAAHLAKEPLIRRPGRTLGYVGQLYALQGVEVLLEALAQLPAHRLRVVGGKPAELADLAARGRALGVEGRLELLGYVEPAEVEAAITEVDVLLLPSRNAGRMPYVAHTKAFEYLAWGRPIIAADLPSIREEMGGGRAAQMVEAESPAAWAQAVRALDTDSQRAEALVREAHALAQRFTWESRAERMLSFFREA